MPLAQGSSQATISKNIATERRAGKSAAQAAAIAYSVAGEDQAPAAGIMFKCGERVLLLERADGSGWGFTGGTIEVGEDADTAARREANEEIGVPWDGELTDMGSYGNFRMYRADVADEFIPRLNDEHTSYGWFGREDMPEELFEDNDSILNDAFAQDARDSARQYDINGWFEVEDNPISLVGVFPYLGKSIPDERKRGNSDKVFNVLRPAEELNNEATLASIRLLPWIIDHTMLGDGTKDTITTDNKGARGVIGEKIWFDPSLGEYGGIRANIKCFSEILAQQIKSGKIPLSLGYRCMYVYSPGVFNGVPYTYVMRFIRGNHLASVDAGRMGDIVAVMDNADFSTQKVQQMPQATKPVKGKKPRQVKLSQTALALLRAQLNALGMDAEDTEGKPPEKLDVMKQAADLINQIKPLMEALAALQCVGQEPAEVEVADSEIDDPVRTNTRGTPGAEPRANAEDEDDEAKKAEAMDAAIARGLERLGIRPQAAGLDMQDVYADIKQRDTLASRLSEFVGTFDHAEMTAKQVAAYGVKKLGLVGVPEGGEMVAVQSYLHGRAVPRAGAKATVMATGMDSKDAAGASWLNDQLKEQA